MKRSLERSRKLSATIRAKATELGYVRCGITDASPFTEYLAALKQRIQRYPESAHLYHKLMQNGYPEKLAEWAKSVIVCLRRYGQYRIPEGLDHLFGKSYLVDGRLPYTAEYQAFEAFQAFLKTLGMVVLAPCLVARWAAARAGLGQFGKNNFLYSPNGSWVMIKVWLVDEVLEYDVPQTTTLCPERCTRCIEACPTHALEAPFVMNYGKCIAHLSFNLTSLPPEHVRDDMGTWVYGCDVCQNVCPLNRGTWESTCDFPDLQQIADALTLKRILLMTQEEYDRIIHPRFWYIANDHLWVWKCNALRAMANSGDETYHPMIRAACNDPNKHTRQMAQWAYYKIT
jgi:epoxyqueuosine reductase